MNPHSPDEAAILKRTYPDSGITLSILPWIEQGSHWGPDG